jgi:hypothetical protein
MEQNLSRKKASLEHFQLKVLAEKITMQKTTVFFLELLRLKQHIIKVF